MDLSSVVHMDNAGKLFPAAGALIQMLRNLDCSLRIQDFVKILGKQRQYFLT